MDIVVCAASLIERVCLGMCSTEAREAPFLSDLSPQVSSRFRQLCCLVVLRGVEITGPQPILNVKARGAGEPAAAPQSVKCRRDCGLMSDGISGCSALNVSFKAHQCFSVVLLFVFLGSELTEFGKLGVVRHSEPK